MAFNRRIRLPFVVAITFILNACSQTILSSSVVIRAENATEAFVIWFEQIALQKAEELNAECSLVSRDRQYRMCIIDENQPVSLGFGFSNNGNYLIVVGSTVIHWIPPRTQDVVSGKHIPDRHKLLEDWLNKTLPVDIIENRKRTYTGYDYSESF